MKRDLYSEVSARIAGQLEAGVVPWVKPWRATAGRNMAHNAATGWRYSGVNVIMVWLAMNRPAAYHINSDGTRGELIHGPFEIPGFMTLKQCNKLGGRIKRGSVGTKIYFVKKLTVQDKRKADPDAKRDIMMLQESTVFNLAQCDGLPERIVNPATAKPRNPDQRDSIVDSFVAASGIDVKEGGDKAFYSPSLDFVGMPDFTAFDGADTYYGTLFHELGHATGHKSRCDRDFTGRFGDKAYAAEELVAELCSAFLCAEFDMNGGTRHADYIATWIRLLKDDSKAFFTACSRAEAAAGWLRGKALADEVEEQEAA